MKPVSSRRARARAARATLAAGVTAAALALVPLAGAVAGQVPGTSGARTISGAVEPTRPAFYEPPATISGAPGTILRSEDASYVLDPLGLSTAIARATKVMYVSRDRLARPTAVTGVVIVPRAPWIGFSSRPVISYAAGTQGLADRCAPSRQMADGAEYEVLGFGGLVTSGYAVAMTDYQGLGTPGTHTYMNRVAQGQAVLDMARAAQRLSGTGLSASSPVGIMGYSQGGGAAAAAAELQPTYAAELRLKGVMAGAVPADLGAVGENLDGGFFSAFSGYGLVGVAAGYDVDLGTYLNPAGMDAARSLEGSCVFDLVNYAFTRSETLTANGLPLSASYAVEPWKGILADNRIGNRKPSVPVYVDHSLLDDTIPYAVGKQLAKDWCARGANVYFSTNASPTHIGGMTNHVAEAPLFFGARFNGLPQISNCWSIW
jgi:predicted esterase